MAKSTPKATTMADLMKSVQTKIVSLEKGENVEGKITKLTPQEILVDIGAKTEAVVLEKDKRLLRNILATLKVGDTVSISVLNPESDLGHPMVSLRRFMGDKVWDKLVDLQKSKEPIEVTVDEFTKGGYLVLGDSGISGFLPNSQVSHTESGNLIGKKINVWVFEINRPLKKVIFSQKTQMDSTVFQNLTKNIKPDQKIDSVITNVAPFGVFTNIQIDKDNSLEGFIHISELSWDKTDEIPDTYKVGEKIQTIVSGFDRDSKRINLSVKRLSLDPIQEKLKNFKTDSKITGTVVQVNDMGIIVKIDDEVEGFVKKDKIPPKVKFEVGSTITATVSDVDTRRRRVILVPVLLDKPIGYR